MNTVTLENIPASTVEQRAIGAAIECFTQKGIHNTSMEDVALQAGMARSTLYRYFKDKDQLIIQVMEKEAMELALKLAAKIKADNFGNFLIEGMLLAVEHIPKHPLLGKMFAPDTLESTHRVIFMANRLSQVAIDAISPAIENAKQQGQLKKTLSPNLLMDWIVRIVFSLVTLKSDTTKNKKQTRLLLETMLLPALME